METAVAWQLRMFQRTLKKKLRLKAFKQLIGRLAPEQVCLLVTCGDNNGAMNYYLRRLGGAWHWADLEPVSLAEMAELLGEEVRLARPDHLPFPDQQFDLVISIDVHEHVADPAVFTGELQRVARERGRILVTVPGGDRRKLVNRLKCRLGMTKAKYGHVRDGFSAEEVSGLMRSASIQPVGEATFSRFFTELIELGINFLYVAVLARKQGREVNEGAIAPQTRQQLQSVGASYRLYALVYPVFWLLSQLDRLLFFTRGYVVIVEGRKHA